MDTISPRKVNSGYAALWCQKYSPEKVSRDQNAQPSQVKGGKPRQLTKMSSRVVRDQAATIDKQL
jgi:hypothetical protein